MQLVWFKRDLRIHDHPALSAAAARGPVFPLYIVEPSLVHAPDFATRHWTFIRGCLHELRTALARLGQPLVVRVGEAVDVLDQLTREWPVEAIWAHEETGNLLSYARDRAVRRWARTRGIPFYELPQNGVVRRLSSRDEWQAHWEQRMSATPASPPSVLPTLAIDPGAIPTAQDLSLPPDTLTEHQPPGETAALRLLDDFLYRRSRNYHRALSSPLTAWEGCSRLSAYLTWGALSIRTVVQKTRQRIAELNANAAPEERSWLRALTAFESRLHWHCHFIQKLEDEPEIEIRNLVRAYDGMREEHYRPDLMVAWAAGRTGYPFVDACMRALTATGWLNFRMRAMLVSFVAYDLWQHWREPALMLARRWIDYEPGIHYCQMQMQAGTSGNRTIRIYNPIKQSIDHDPEGIFIRRWVPELANIPTAYIHTPWLLDRSSQERAGCRIGRDYPAPIVDHDVAYRRARAAIAAVRARPETAQEAAAVHERHGSRRWQATRRRTSGAVTDRQLRLDL
jgi:deoxyribodipyrimidine photo-lyase